MLAPEDEDERVRVQWAGKGEAKLVPDNNALRTTHALHSDDDNDSERDFTPSEGRTTRDSFWGSLKGSVSPHRGGGRRSSSRRRERGSSSSLNSPLNESTSLEREDGPSEPRNISGFEHTSPASRTQSSERSASNDASERDNSNESTQSYPSNVLKRSTSVSGARAIAPWLTSASTMSGPLKKLSSKGWWQKRYVEVRGPFVCYWRSERASRPEPGSNFSHKSTANVGRENGSGNDGSGGGVGLGDAGFKVSMPDAAIDLRTVCGVTVDGLDLILELIPQDEARRGRRSQVHFRCEAAAAHLWQASFKHAIVRYASGGGGLSGGSSEDDSDPSQSPSKVPPAAEIQPNAASTNAVARMQPNPAATTTGVERSDEGDSFPAQYTKSALLAQIQELKSAHAQEMQNYQADAALARLSLKALMVAQHEDDVSRVRTQAAAEVAQARATAEAARVEAKLAKQQVLKQEQEEDVIEAQQRELVQQKQQQDMETSSRAIARLRDQLSSAEATVAEQARSEAQMRVERDNAISKVADLQDKHAATSAAAVVARNEAAALRREVGELRARHLSLGAAVQKRQVEGRREIGTLKQERDDVMAKCQGLAAQLESASRQDQDRRRELHRAQAFAQEQKAALTARAQEAVTAASARISELSAMATAAASAQHQAERVADEATYRARTLEATASQAVAAARASELAVDRANEQAQRAAKVTQEEISKRLFAEKRAQQAEEKRQSLSGEVKALTAQLTATQSSRDQAQQQVNQLRRSAKSEAKAYTDVQAQVTSLEAELRAATAASAEAEQSHAEALKTATISAEAQITAMTQKHAEAIHTSQQEVDALAQEVTALKSSEAAALDEMRDTQAQLAKVQAQHQLAQTAATGQARSDAAVAHEEELRNAQKLQHEAEEREQKANEQLQQLTAALEAARAEVLGVAQIGSGDEFDSRGLHSPSPQEAAVERLVSDYVRAIEASKKEAAAFADAVESLTVEHQSSEAAARDDLQDTRAQLAEVQAQHQLAQTAATGHARSEAAVAHEEELRHAQKLQREAEEREQKANEQLQQLTAALEAARADVLGAAQSGGGDEIATQGLHSTSPQEAAVERLVSDYVRAIEASKKEAAAFADAVESLTVEHNATMEQLADAHAQMALTAAADALEILEESEASGNRSERGAAAQIVVSEAVKGTAVKPMAMAAGEGEGEASAPAIVVEKKRGTAAAARAMAAEEGEEVARAEPSPEALQLAEHEELRARTAQLTKELETARTETVAVQKALREKTERAESEAKKTKNEMKRLREELHQAQSEKDYTAKNLASTQEELAAAKDAVTALESAEAAQDDEDRAVRGALDGVLRSELNQIREASNSRRKSQISTGTKATPDSTTSVSGAVDTTAESTTTAIAAASASSNSINTPVVSASSTNTTTSASSDVAPQPTRVLSRRRSSVSVGRSSVSVGRSTASIGRPSVSVGRPVSIGTGVSTSNSNIQDAERSRNESTTTAAIADAEKKMMQLQAECDQQASVIRTHAQQMAALEEHHARALDTQFASFQEEKQRFLLEVQASAPEAALVQAYEEDDNDNSTHNNRVVRNLLAAGYRLSSDLRKAKREIEDLKTAATRSSELHAAHMVAAEADASKLRSLLAYTQVVAASLTASSPSAASTQSSSLLSSWANAEAPSYLSDVAEAEAKLEAIASKHQTESSTLRQKVTDLQEQLKQQQQPPRHEVLALPGSDGADESAIDPSPHKKNSSGTEFHAESSEVQQYDVALKQEHLQQRLQELKSLFEHALNSNTHANALTSASTEVMPGMSNQSAGEFPRSLTAMPPKLSTVPTDGEHGAVWWYQHRATHRANQLFGLYTFLVATCLDAE